MGLDEAHVGMTVWLRDMGIASLIRPMSRQVMSRAPRGWSIKEIWAASPLVTEQSVNKLG